MEPESTYNGAPISLDVVANESQIRIYTRGDLSDATNCTYLDEFPQPGMCGVSTDVYGCSSDVDSCLTHVRFRGAAIDVTMHQSDDIVIPHDGGGGTLEIDGCGSHWSASIPAGRTRSRCHW
ncbi:hypothetical protein BH11MYX2_BH11MYX2_40560 [soil metagenome]